MEDMRISEDGYSRVMIYERAQLAEKGQKAMSTQLSLQKEMRFFYIFLCWKWVHLTLCFGYEVNFHSLEFILWRSSCRCLWSSIYVKNSSYLSVKMNLNWRIIKKLLNSCLYFLNFFFSFNFLNYSWDVGNYSDS